jgi:hypothetical protein
MSIFREPFAPEIKGQLEARQNLIGKDNKDTHDVVYLNSKTAWIQLRSSVDVEFNGRISADGMATDNVLLGGALLSGNQQREGIGTKGLGRYDTSIYNKSLNQIEPNILGIRPMPGITNLSIQNKGAYGSLRQATVTFQCWDVKQLEMLEMLYMRPGYTVLLEWGWLPYITNKGKLTDRLFQDTSFFGRKDINLQKYLSSLRKRSLIDSHGNYDAMFGYIMNYSWKYRMDGGYDCTTEIISTGEVLESLKINASGASVSSTSSGTLLSTERYSNIEDIQKEYRRNLLTGIISETYALALLKQTSENGVGSFTYDNQVYKKSGTVDFARLEIELETEGIFSGDDAAAAKNPGGEHADGSILDQESNVYITLDSFVRLLNDFALLENNNISDAGGPNGKNIVTLSTQNRPNSLDAGKALTCLYHPLQISVDPRVCIIRNDLFEKSIQGISISPPAENNQDVKIIPIKPNPNYDAIIQNLKNIRNKGGSEKEFRAELSKINSKEMLAGVADTYYIKYNEKFYEFLTSGGFVDSDMDRFSVTEQFSNLGITYEDVIYFENDVARAYTEFKQKWADSELFRFTGQVAKADILTAFLDATPEERKARAIESAKQKTKEQIETLDEAKEEINSSSPGYLSTLNQLPKYYHSGNTDPFAYHGNIYLNLRLLYNLATSTDLESEDPAEKQTISLMTYVKDVLTYCQNSIGNVNNFEVVIEDNVGYIVDVNNVPGKKVTPFTFEIGSKKSVIRNISLESQIFSDQSTIIAVAAQSDAGKLGLENSTMIAYNTGIRDRMISKRDNPVAANTSKEAQITGFTLALTDLAELFNSMDRGFGFDSELQVDDIDKYKKALTDIIVFFTSQYKADNKYKSILPSKLSITTDGIGGLIIGNIFNIDKTFTPQGYKGDKGVGIDLQYIITNIKQEVGSNGQWTTIIEGNPFIPDSTFDSLVANQNNLKINPIKKTFIYDENTGQVREEIEKNNDPLNEPPQGVTGDARAMASAMNYVLGGPKKGKGLCNRYTYNLAYNYTKFRAGKKNETKRGANLSSGGDAGTPGAFAAYEALGYTKYKVGNNMSISDIDTYLSTYSKFNVGDVIQYRSNITVPKSKGNDYCYHAQIYTGGMGWNSSTKSFMPMPDAARYATDDSANYRSNNNNSGRGAGNFLYGKYASLKVPPKFDLWVFKILS